MASSHTHSIRARHAQRRRAQHPHATLTRDYAILPMPGRSYWPILAMLSLPYTGHAPAILCWCFILAYSDSNTVHRGLRLLDPRLAAVHHQLRLAHGGRLWEDGWDTSTFKRKFGGRLQEGAPDRYFFFYATDRTEWSHTLPINEYGAAQTWVVITK